MLMQPLFLPFVTQGLWDAGRDWHACSFQATCIYRQATRTQFPSGACNAEKAMMWTDQGLHLWEEAFTLVSAVNA